MSSGRSDKRAAKQAARAGKRAARADEKRATAEAYLHIVPAGEPATPQARGFDTCPCPKDCTLHGECHLCVAYHGRKDVLPRCLR